MIDRRSPRIRCAIYTRKSSDEGLEQDFNSLHAQREACEAYVLSQRHEGWQALSEQYDDGGYSGGTMERPGLKRLLADIRDKRIDVVVVYKVDRLTRSLSDFAKIVDVFDGQGVSFVSVTQQFNTTSSMGRLTLNVLLSFAQFEREVTGERIRDKIAASKKKGMWMGGTVPLGYDAKDRSLAVNTTEAQTVQLIFRRYLQLKSVLKLERDLAVQKIATKQTVTAAGRTIGGRPFSRGHLYKLLANPIYRGEIQHRGVRHKGLHEPLIDQETWDAVQQLLATNSRERLAGTSAAHPSLLAGLLVDHRGGRLTATHATKNGKRYRYYKVSAAAGAEFLAAGETEQVIQKALEGMLRDPATILKGHGSDLSPSRITELLARLSTLARILEQGSSSERRTALLELVEQIRVTPDRFEIFLKSDISRLAENITVLQPIIAQRPNIQTAGPKAIVLNGNPSSGLAKASTELNSIARGFGWFEDLTSGRATSAQAIAKREGMTDSYVCRLIGRALTFCEAPDRAEDLLAANQKLK